MQTKVEHIKIKDNQHVVSQVNVQSNTARCPRTFYRPLTTFCESPCMTINVIGAAHRGLHPLQMWGAQALEGPAKWTPLGKKE